MKPRLFFVGAPKSGTTALTYFLKQHPQISMCEVKETNYFCRDLDMARPKTEAEYLSLFPITEETKILADASILAMYSHEAAAEIADYADDPKILMLLRNPVESMYSWHSQMVYRGNEPIKCFQSALAAEPERKQGRLIPEFETTQRVPQLLFYRDVMRYWEQVERYFSRFERKNIHIVLYDDFKADTIETYGEILDFIGLDPFIPSVEKVNSNKFRRNEGLYLFVKKTFGKASRSLPSKLRLQLAMLFDRLNTTYAPRETLEPEVVQALKQECKPDIIKLESLLDRDLSHWYQ
ncbi:MAG: sulfotransferase domain-containing protein [Microcoleaceae cyanobacterium]